MVVDPGRFARPKRASGTTGGDDLFPGTIHHRHSHETAGEGSMCVESALSRLPKHGTFYRSQLRADAVDLLGRAPLHRFTEVRELPPQSRHQSYRPFSDVVAGRLVDSRQALSKKLRIGQGDVEQSEAALAATARARHLVGVSFLNPAVPTLDLSQELEVIPHSGRV